MGKKENTITEKASCGKQIVEVTSEATVTTVITTDSSTGTKTITATIVPTTGKYNYKKTTVITSTSTGKTIKESYVKEDK